MLTRVLYAHSLNLLLVSPVAVLFARYRGAPMFDSDFEQQRRLDLNEIVGVGSHIEAISVCEAHGLWLSQVAVHGWLIRGGNSRVGPWTVVGCIDEHDGIFELMEIDGGFRWTSFDTLRAATSFLADPTRSPVDERRFDSLTDRVEDAYQGLKVTV